MSNFLSVRITQTAIRLVTLAVSIVTLSLVAPNAHTNSVAVLTGRIVAAGIPGASGITAVGTFHPGGPIHDKPAFQRLTLPGAVLDPERILVTSTSNFGAPLAANGNPAGAVVSIDPRGASPLVIPQDFAKADGQVNTLGGSVILYSSNSPTFLNRVYNPAAVTADLSPVTVPTAISLNNAFGRIWVTNAPLGLQAAGLHSVIDPDGRPLDGAPDRTAGGVFKGDLTNRNPQLIAGSMTTGALATALLGKSPDGSGRAVFAGLNADGSVVQVHVAQGVDGLAPPGTITPLNKSLRAGRSGMVFNWVPDPILYVADPMKNSIVALSLVADGKVFRVKSTTRYHNSALDLPIDIAPAVPEIASALFSSNTTAAGASDLYVANRGNGTIARLKQDGTVVAVRRVAVAGMSPLGPGRINGIAVSPDAARIWISVTGRLPGYPEGAVIELPAFGAPASSSR